MDGSIKKTVQNIYRGRATKTLQILVCESSEKIYHKVDVSVSNDSRAEVPLKHIRSTLNHCADIEANPREQFLIVPALIKRSERGWGA